MVATATTTFLSKPSDLNVLGLNTSADGNQVLLTIQDDGVVAYDVAKQSRASAWVIDSQTSFAAPVASIGGQLVAVLQPQGASAASLACCDASHARLHDSQQRTPLSDAVVRVVQIASNAAGAVCCDGSIVAAVNEGTQCRTVHAQCGNGQLVVVEAATAGGNMVHSVWHGEDVGQRMLQSFVLNQAGELQHAGQLMLEVGSQPAGVHVAHVHITVGGRACLTWSHGLLQVFATRGVSSAPTAPLAPLFSLDTSPYLHTPPTPPTPPPAAAAAGTPRSKRRNGAAVQHTTTAVQHTTSPADDDGSSATAPKQSCVQPVLLSQGVLGMFGWGRGQGAALQLLLVDIRYGQLLGQLPINDPGATGTSLRSTDVRGALKGALLPIAAAALPGHRAVVAVNGALLTVECSGVTARMASIVRSQLPAHHTTQHTAAEKTPEPTQPTPLLYAPVYYGTCASVGRGALVGEDRVWQAHLARPVVDAGALLPQPAADVCEVDRAARQQLGLNTTTATTKHHKNEKNSSSSLSPLVDAALQGSLPLPTIGALACRLATQQQWPLLQRLATMGCLPSLCMAPGVLPAAARAHEFVLLAALMQRCYDVGADDLTATLVTLLGCDDGRNPQSAAAAVALQQMLVSQHEGTHKGASSHKGGAHKGGKQRAASQKLNGPASHGENHVGAANGHADVAMASSDDEEEKAPTTRRNPPTTTNGGGDDDDHAASHPASLFPPWAAPLHALVAAKHDNGVLLQALRGLAGGNAVRLGEYLAVWMDWYGRGMACSAPAVAPVGALPCLSAVLTWTSTLIDAQMMSLVLQARSSGDQQVKHMLETLQASVVQLITVGKRLAKLKGPLEHVAAGAPLPTTQGATWSAQYSVEVLHT